MTLVPSATSKRLDAIAVRHGYSHKLFDFNYVEPLQLRSRMGMLGFERGEKIQGTTLVDNEVPNNLFTHLSIKCISHAELLKVQVTVHRILLFPATLPGLCLAANRLHEDGGPPVHTRSLRL